MNLSSLTEVISLVLGLIGLSSSIVGFFFWYKSAIEKRYAAERAFSHIQSAQQQLGEYVKLVDADVQSVDKTLIEIKALVLANNQAINFLSAKVTDGNSFGWGKPPYPPMDQNPYP